jgi:hypothetical protein
MLDSHRFTQAAGTLALCATLVGAAPIDAQSDREGYAAVPAPVRTLLTRLPADPDGWRPEGMEGAVAMQMLPLAGREDLVARFAPGAFRHASCPPLAGEPLAELAADARDAQIVIVNEAHDQPLHRWVIRELGLALADRFDVFAAETFVHEEIDERESGRISDRLGSYADEPIFGRELRALDRAGYRFVAYEIRAGQRAAQDAPMVDRVVTREEAQAENLIAAVLTDEPDARIVVHVGYSHALEAAVNNFEREIEWFAARLKRKTGIDLLTISQTHCSLDEQGGNAWDGLRLADGAGAVEREGAIDRFLAHPPLQFEAGRPAWRRAVGDVEVPVPEALRSDDQRVIVEARAPQEAFDEVPVDRLLLYPGESLPLLLPPGRWRLTAWTGDGALGDPVVVEAAL